MSVAGVDGCKGGFCAVVLGDGAPPRLLLAPRFDALRVAMGPLEAVAVDMPIGLLPEGRTGYRACDAAAKRALGAAHASVFVPPTRRQLEAPSGLLAQTRAILPRLRDVDASLRARPDASFVEAHPELAFRRLFPRTAFLSKRLADGRAQRRRALLRLSVIAPSPVRAGDVRAAEDDVLDATVLAVVAARLVEGCAAPLPHEAQWDPVLARPMVLVAPTARRGRNQAGSASRAGGA